MTTLQRSTSRTLHLRSRESGGGSGGSLASGTAGAYSRPVQRSGPPVVIRLEPVRSPSSNATPAADGMANGSPVSSDTLLRGAKVVQIMHNGEAYQLRATRHGKLILTK